MCVERLQVEYNFQSAGSYFKTSKRNLCHNERVKWCIFNLSKILHKVLGFTV